MMKGCCRGYRWLGVVLCVLSACGTEEDIIIAGDRVSVFERSVSLLVEQDDITVIRQLPPERVNVSWSQVGGVASTMTGHLAFSSTPQQLWQISGGYGATSTVQLFSVPIMAEGRLYILDGAMIVRAFHVRNGQQDWQRDVSDVLEDSQALAGGIAYDRGRLYVATGHGEIFALQASSGQVIWRERLPVPPRGAPTLDGEHVFVLTIDNRTLAYNSSDGSLFWEYSGINEPLGLLKTVSPATDGTLVISGSTSGELVALSALTGRLLWSDTLTRSQETGIVRTLTDVLGQSVIVDDQVFAVNNSGLLVAIDSRDGVRLWELPMSSINTPWVAGEVIFVLTTRSELAAIRRVDGEILWAIQLQRFVDEEEGEDRIIWNGPILAGQTLWVTNSNAELVGINATDGLVRLSLPLPAPAYLPPILANQTLYVLSEDAQITAFR